MSDYTRVYNFTVKDSLPTGDSGKVIKGTEIDVELNAAAASIASKSDINSPTFTGTPEAPTATGGTNTTQIATTAYVINERAVTGTLTNKTINLGSNTLVATSAQMAAALTDETGSGSLVFGTSPTIATPTISSPTLTGTPVAPTAAAGTNSTQVATCAFVLTNGVPSGGTGFGVRTDSVTTVLRTLTSGSGISITNGNGVAGNPVIANSGVLSVNSEVGALTLAGSTGITATTTTGTVTLTPSSGYNGYGVRTVSTSAPSGGNNGDIWYQV